MRDRELARLNQTVCGLEGLATLLARSPGDFAVVLHGPADCAGLLVQETDTPGVERFFCTHLEEHELIAGRSLKRLEQCLDAILSSDTPPEAVFVLGTCASALVGDDLQSLLSQKMRSTGVPLALPHGGGMGWISQSRLLDRFYLLMLDACAPRPVERHAHAVNLVGFDPGEEMCARLAGQGIEINAILTPGADWKTWSRAGRASCNLYIDLELFALFQEQAGRRFSQRAIQVPPPVGYAGSRAFLASLERTWPGPRKPSWSLPEPPALLADVRMRVAGRRMGFNIGSTKNLEAPSLALEGLSDLSVFMELGFEVRILVQGDDRPERRKAVRRTLRRLGCQAPVSFFADTVDFGALCQRHSLDLVYASDHLASCMGSCGAAFLPLGSLRPGFGDVEANLRLILQAFERTSEAR